MSNMQTDEIKIDKHIPKNLGQYFYERIWLRWYGSQRVKAALNGVLFLISWILKAFNALNIFHY